MPRTGAYLGPMAKPALIVVATAFLGGMTALAAVSVPNAIRAHRNASQVPFAAERGLSSLRPLIHRELETPPTQAAIDLKPVTVLGVANRLDQTELARATAVLEPEPQAPAPCSPEWLSLESGPSDRHYRELCPDEITGKALAPPERAKPDKPLERMITPSHPASADHLVDPRADLAERPLSIGE
jgi:hypothetical protein